MNHQDIDRRSLMMHRIIAARLRARPKTDRVAVTHSSRGLQPTESSAKNPCRVAPPQSPPPAQPCAVRAVPLRDTDTFNNRPRGLKPTATVRHHYVVKMAYRFLAEMPVHAAAYPPAFLPRLLLSHAPTALVS